MCSTETATTSSGRPTDLLTLQCLPEWPAANVLLRLFAKALNGGKVSYAGWLCRHPSRACM